MTNLIPPNSPSLERIGVIGAGWLGGPVGRALDSRSVAFILSGLSSYTTGADLVADAPSCCASERSSARRSEPRT